jgi:hypothetical protein
VFFVLVTVAVGRGFRAELDGFTHEPARDRARIVTAVDS